MAHLEARKEVLEARLAQGEDVKVSVHPSMASVYRERVANLRDALAKEGCQAEAAEIMRTLIDKIVLTPVCRDGKETLSITLHGDLAGILGPATKSHRAARGERPCGGVHKIGCGGRIRTCDLQVMSLTSYRTAPPRGIGGQRPDARSSGAGVSRGTWQVRGSGSGS